MSDIDKKGYTVIPNKIFELGLKSTAIHVLIFVFKWKNGNTSNMSLTFIENGTNLSRNTVIQALKTLEEKKCILINRKGAINKIISNLPFFELKTKKENVKKPKKAKKTPPKKGDFKTKYMDSCDDMFGSLKGRS